MAGAAREFALELELGNFAPGRFAWQLTNIVRLATPVPARGFQKVWNFIPSAEVLAELRGRG